MGYRKLGLLSAHRRSVLRNGVTSLLREERIETTETRAKELARLANKMITLGKKGDLHARRQAIAFITDEDVVVKLFDTLGPKYEDRSGGYTRIIKTGFRRGDGAPMTILELV